MFCVIQEVEKKKQEQHGYPKEIISEYTSFSFNGKDMSHYYHHYSEERFERPIRKAYRISIHSSYRENRKVKKKQYALCTVDYYDFACGYFSYYDYCGWKIEKAAKELNVEIDYICELVRGKVDRLIEKIKNEFSKTEEFKTHKRHERIIKEYEKNKKEFASRYSVSEDDYDKCYDVFGELKNPGKLEEIKLDYIRRMEYEEKSRSYQENFYRNYSNYFGGSVGNSNNHTEDDKEILKQFYRVLSKKYHPDTNPGIDTSKEMKLINQLKNEWGV